MTPRVLPHRTKLRWNPLGALCAVNVCERPAAIRDLCRAHYSRLRLGIPLDSPIRPIGKPGTGRPRKYKFVKAPEGHPNANAQGMIAVHRLAMAQKLGRPLLPGEAVHHKNGKQDDNRPRNLELWITSHPYGQRVPDVIAHAEEMLRRYAPHKLAKKGTIWGEA